MNFQIISYILIAMGTLWGILTLISLREEEKYIQELCRSAEESSKKKMTHLSHGSE